jgi:Holliday junction resolvasome RuvABC DNA-binding subunit
MTVVRTNRDNVYNALKALGFSEKHVHELLDAEAERREKAKEETFKEETEELLRNLDV